MVIRTPMGGYRGYGATHSQTIEKMFFGIPNVNIMAMNILQKPNITLNNAINNGKPTLLIENKIDYGRNLFDDYDKYDVNYRADLKAYYVNIKNESNIDGHIVLYGGMVSLGLEVIWDIFMKYERNFGLIVPVEISPFNIKILDVVKNKDLYVLEESNKEGGFSSEIARIILEENININKFKIFSAKNECIPSSIHLEIIMLLL
jgi:pyruvate/2-oxoglutarate/acetoin dehydrogenase E1 component